MKSIKPSIAKKSKKKANKVTDNDDVGSKKKMKNMTSKKKKSVNKTSSKTKPIKSKSKRIITKKSKTRNIKKEWSDMNETEQKTNNLLRYYLEESDSDLSKLQQTFTFKQIIDIIIDTKRNDKSLYFKYIHYIFSLYPTTDRLLYNGHRFDNIRHIKTETDASNSIQQHRNSLNELINQHNTFLKTRQFVFKLLKKLKLKPVDWVRIYGVNNVNKYQMRDYFGWSAFAIIEKSALLYELNMDDLFTDNSIYKDKWINQFIVDLVGKIDNPESLRIDLKHISEEDLDRNVYDDNKLDAEMEALRTRHWDNDATATKKLMRIFAPKFDKNKILEWINIINTMRKPVLLCLELLLSIINGIYDEYDENTYNIKSFKEIVDDEEFDPNCDYCFGSENDIFSVLYYVIQAGDIRMLRKLLSHKDMDVNIDCKYEYGWHGSFRRLSPICEMTQTHWEASGVGSGLQNGLKEINALELVCNHSTFDALYGYQQRPERQRPRNGIIWNDLERTVSHPMYIYIFIKYYLCEDEHLYDYLLERQREHEKREKKRNEPRKEKQSKMMNDECFDEEDDDYVYEENDGSRYMARLINDVNWCGVHNIGDHCKYTNFEYLYGLSEDDENYKELVLENERYLFGYHRSFGYDNPIDVYKLVPLIPFNRYKLKEFVIKLYRYIENGIVINIELFDLCLMNLSIFDVLIMYSMEKTNDVLHHRKWTNDWEYVKWFDQTQQRILDAENKKKGLWRKKQRFKKKKKMKKMKAGPLDNDIASTSITNTKSCDESSESENEEVLPKPVLNSNFPNKRKPRLCNYAGSPLDPKSTKLRLEMIEHNVYCLSRYSWM